jgi:anti-sigma regulatory factor (Ser/Thr protein kinase)
LTATWDGEVFVVPLILDEAEVNRRMNLPSESGWLVQTYPGSLLQVRAVRCFVRDGIAEHPAAADTVIVASELATNSVIHSSSCLPGGRFVVRLAVIDKQRAGIVVTDEGGPFCPSTQVLGLHSESGRGLEVVKALSSLFWVHEHDGFRSFCAVVANLPAPLANCEDTDLR